VIHLHTSARAELLAGHLAEVLSEHPADPMAPEWVAVPSDGMRRWLPLQLARHLGARGPGGGDGVAANFRLPFPGALRVSVLNAERGTEPDPWSVERLVWVVLAAMEGHRDDPALAALAALPFGASLYGRARRVADAFDRYHVHRPDMVRAWAHGDDTDGLGYELPDHHRWQPHLWRLARHMVAEPSPPERLPPLLRRLAEGSLTVGLPDRLSVFGLTALPGGEGFLELARSLAVHREVHLFLLEPSPLGDGMPAAVGPPRSEYGMRLRSEDLSAREVNHPLLQSWGRLQREASLLLAGARQKGFPAPHRLGVDPGGEPSGGVLAQLQADIRGNAAPSGSARTGAIERSVRFHACHGPTRQVEVLRDVLLHLLSDQELDLCEDDVLVACPSLERFAPLIDAVFGPSAGAADPGGSSGDPEGSGSHAPALRYRIADRSVRDFNAVLSATSELIELVGGRFEASAVLDFLSLAPVRHRARFTDDDLSQIAQWVDDANVRWGLDPQHRSQFWLPPAVVTNTWRSALDRLLLGSAVFDGPLGLAIGETPVIGVEGEDVVTVGRLAELLELLAGLAEATTKPRAIAAWVDLLRESAGALFDTPPELHWQLGALWTLLDDVAQSVPDDPAIGETLLEFTDLRRVFGDRLRDTPGRPDFFRGGITVSSLTPLRGIPFRVVCLLGMDESAFGAGTADGDDLAALKPVLGDPDPRAEDRLSLLELVMAAGDRLVLLRDGYDVRTNHKVPPAVIVEELREALAQTVHADDRPAFGENLETVHPRQAFDEACFIPDALVPGSPWGFDGGDLAGAQARRRRTVDRPAFLGKRLPGGGEELIELSDLHRFLQNPVKAFVEQHLGVRLPRSRESVDDHLPVAPEGLERWQIGQRLLNAALDGVEGEEWARVERRLGTLPPSLLGDELIAQLQQTVTELISRAEGLGWQRGAGAEHPVDLALGDGVRIRGTVRGLLAPPDCGPARILFSRGKPAHRVAAWLDLMALAAMEVPGGCRSLVVARAPGSGQGLWSVNLVPRAAGGRESALAALRVIVSCYRRGGVEPVPLFPTLSYKVHEGQAGPGDWVGGYGGRSDGDDPSTRLAFGEHDFRSLLALPAGPGDPDGPGGRVERFARFLYGALDDSVVDLVAASPGAPA